MKQTVSDQRKKLADRLYYKFGKPLEDKYWGKYIAISKDGKTALSSDLLDVFKQSETFTSESYIFKVGEKAVYKWR